MRRMSQSAPVKWSRWRCVMKTCLMLPASMRAASSCRRIPFPPPQSVMNTLPFSSRAKQVL